jgi:exopolysaccharide biosynthesis polyprenyl glycosylphosphotransferase
MGFFAEISLVEILKISIFVYAFWLLLFVFYGQYRSIFAYSRIDEFITIAKTISMGVLIIFLITFDLEKDFRQPFRSSRMIILSYWAMMIIIVGFGRILLRTIHRHLLEKGIGRRKTLIIGWGKKAWELFEWIFEAPALGYEIVGFVTTGNQSLEQKYRDIPVRGQLNGLNHIIEEENIQEIIIALSRRSERRLEEVIEQCNGTSVGMKIVPDLYDVIIGQVRTNQIYGFPLIEILPQLITPWEQIVKRTIDVIFSFIILGGFLPIWLIIAILIKFNSKGPIFYTQKRVGKDGKIFKMIKFRSMVSGAEEKTGPVWAADNDPRVTTIGRLLRKLRLDEIPQFINILDGDMSLVGPRPERPFFVKKLREELPLYSRRLRIRPGLTGWAQVKGDYDQSIEDVKRKLEYDLFYIENMSLRMDLKIIINTIYVMLKGKGQ